MSHDHDVNVRNMVWRPALVRLTQIPHPEVDGGKSSPCFIDPTTVVCILRHRATHWNQPQEGHIHGKTDMTFRCGTDSTCVQLSGGGGSIFVEESPEQVAAAVNRAIGHEPEKPKAVT